MAAGGALYTVALLQSYQTDLLKDLNEGHRLSPEAVAKLRWTMELTLKATKQTATAIARSMMALVVTESYRVALLHQAYQLLI